MYKRRSQQFLFDSIIIKKEENKIKKNSIKSLLIILILITVSAYFLISCTINKESTSDKETTTDSTIVSSENTRYPSDVIPFFDKWHITLGSGSGVNDLINYEHKDYFYDTNDGTDWVVYKTPNSGGTTRNSSNTRSELKQSSEWIPETGGKLTGTLKVMHVSTTGDARVPATF